MPICIECRYPVSRLYHVLHSGNTGSRKPPPINRSTKPTPPNTAKKGELPARSKPKSAAAVSGGEVRLTQCPRCKRFADKYVEHDYIVLFIDLVLVKPQVRLGLPKTLVFCIYTRRDHNWHSCDFYADQDNAGLPSSPLQPPGPR